jgi:hypothetical protein
MKLEKNTPLSNFMKIHPVGGELFPTDTQTDMTKLTVAIRNFVNAPKEVPPTRQQVYRLWVFETA